MHGVLFVLTLLSMMAAGAMQQGVDPLVSLRTLVHLIEGVPFAATLLTILTVHEFGHYFAARSWGVKASLPYFLPLPYVSFRHAGRRDQNSFGHSAQARSTRHWRSWPISWFLRSRRGLYFGLCVHRSFPATTLQPPIELGAPLLFSAIAHVICLSIHSSKFCSTPSPLLAGWPLYHGIQSFPSVSSMGVISRMPSCALAQTYCTPGLCPAYCYGLCGIAPWPGYLVALGLARLARKPFSHSLWQGPSCALDSYTKLDRKRAGLVTFA